MLNPTPREIRRLKAVEAIARAVVHELEQSPRTAASTASGPIRDLLDDLCSTLKGRTPEFWASHVRRDCRALEILPRPAEEFAASTPAHSSDFAALLPSDSRLPPSHA